uniref:Odorant receptor n=2 Tax=Dendroctonus ponderosae TaxID=77166 RepID=A0AAR5PLI2_DENPD
MLRSKHLDALFQAGIERGDIFWMLDISVSAVSGNCVIFAYTLVILLQCVIEVTGQLYLLTTKPSIGKILLLAPMFFTSFMVITTIIALLFQRSSHGRIYSQYEALSMEQLRRANKPILAEVRQLFDAGIYQFAAFLAAVALGSIGYLPLNEFDYEHNVWPAIQALKLIEDGPKAVIYTIATLNYLVMPGKGCILLLYGLHIMHLCSLYCVSSILLRGKLKGIAVNRPAAADLMLSDQAWVTQELKSCIKQDVRLKTFCSAIIDHFKWILLFHVALAVIILSLLYYINLFLNGGYSPLGSRCFVAIANILSFTYSYNSENFREQVENIRQEICNLPWYSFNKCNQKLVHVFLSNMLQPRYLSVGGLFDANHEFLVLVMHKVFNVLTILSNLDPDRAGN